MKSWIFESATEFAPSIYRIYLGRRAVPSTDVFTRHSNGYGFVDHFYAMCP